MRLLIDIDIDRRSIHPIDYIDIYPSDYEYAHDNDGGRWRRTIHFERALMIQVDDDPTIRTDGTIVHRIQAARQRRAALGRGGRTPMAIWESSER